MRVRALEMRPSPAIFTKLFTFDQLSHATDSPNSVYMCPSEQKRQKSACPSALWMKFLARVPARVEKTKLASIVFMALYLLDLGNRVCVSVSDTV